MRIVKPVVEIVITIIVIFFILVGGLNYFSAPDATGLFGYKGYVVTSGSMEPTFSPGDYVIVKKESFENIEKDDIVTFTENDTIVTHRVEDVASGSITTQGDANDNADSKNVIEDHYVGTLQWIVPSFGKVIIFMQQPFVFPVLIFIVGAYILFSYYYGSDDEEGTATEN